MSYLGEETKVAGGEEKKGSMIPILGEAAAGFLSALGFGKKADVTAEGTDWTPIIMTGGAIVGGIVLLSVVMKKPARRRAAPKRRRRKRR